MFDTGCLDHKETVCKGQSEVVLLQKQQINSKDFLIFHRNQKFIMGMGGWNKIVLVKHSSVGESTAI
jgi:hypothetical protein